MKNILIEQPLSSSTETYTWFTDVIESLNGKENRLQIRSLPRVTSDIKLYINQNRHLEYFNNLKSGVDGIWKIPDFMGAVYLGAINQGERIAQNVFNQLSGEQLFIYQNGKLNECVTWLTVANNNLIFKFNDKLSANNLVFIFENDSEELGSETEKVKRRYSEAYAVKLNDVYISNVKLQTSGYGCNLSYQAEYINEIDYPSDKVTSYQGYEVIHNNYVVSETTIKQDIDAIDYETGIITRLKKWDRTKLLRSIIFYLDNYSQIYEFKKLIYRLAGRFIPFWLCDDSSAFVISSQRGNVIYCKYNNDISISKIPLDHVAIFTNSDVIYTKIADYKISGAYIELTLKESIVEKVNKIAYLTKYRFDSDSVTIEYNENQKASAEIPIIEVFND